MLHTVGQHWRPAVIVMPSSTFAVLHEHSPCLPPHCNTPFDHQGDVASPEAASMSSEPGQEQQQPPSGEDFDDDRDSASRLGSVGRRPRLDFDEQYDGAEEGDDEEVEGMNEAEAVDEDTHVGYALPVWGNEAPPSSSSPWQSHQERQQQQQQAQGHSPQAQRGFSSLFNSSSGRGEARGGGGRGRSGSPDEDDEGGGGRRGGGVRRFDLGSEDFDADPN